MPVDPVWEFLKFANLIRLEGILFLFYCYCCTTTCALSGCMDVDRNVRTVGIGKIDLLQGVNWNIIHLEIQNQLLTNITGMSDVVQEVAFISASAAATSDSDSGFVFFLRWKTIGGHPYGTSSCGRIGFAVPFRIVEKSVFIMGFC